MGFWRGAGRAMGHIVDVRVDRWVGVETIRTNTQLLWRYVKSLFQVEQLEQAETFEAAIKRLNLTEQDIQQQQRRYSVLVYVFLSLALGIFSYGVYLAWFHNWQGFILALALSVYSLSQAFRYDFWVFQLNRRKLGCSVKEWWSA